MMSALWQVCGHRVQANVHEAIHVWGCEGSPHSNLSTHLADLDASKVFPELAQAGPARLTPGVLHPQNCCYTTCGDGGGHGFPARFWEREGLTQRSVRGGSVRDWRVNAWVTQAITHETSACWRR
jgi:hypothetical protein